MRFRGWGILGPLTFFLLLALLVMAPVLRSGRLVSAGAGDLTAHVSGIVEATSALAEGQFPIRIAPAANDGLRYPFFAYYGNFPYTAGGLLCRVFHVNAYTSWKIVHILSLTLGGFYLFRCSRTLMRKTLPSIAAGAVFVLAPYMWTDVHARWAFPEVVAFNLLPVVLFYSLRAMTTRRLGAVLLGGVAWSLLALSHNIAFLYASALFGAFFALTCGMSMCRRGRRVIGLRRAVAVGGAYLVGLLLTAWYLVPQVYTVKHLVVDSVDTNRPVGGDVLTTPAVLLWPTLRTPPGANTANFGLQIGWPILAGVLLAFASVLRKRTPNRGMVVALLALFFSSAIIVAMPSIWWAAVPKIFYHVQSSYRLLMFVVLAGSVLCGIGVSAWWGDRMGRRSFVAVLMLLGVSCVAYVPRHALFPGAALARFTEHPNLGGNGATTNYLLSVASAARTSLAHPDVNYADREHGLLSRDGWIERRPTEVPERETFFPHSAIEPGTTILIDGAVPREYGKLPATLFLTFDNVSLPPIPLKTAESFHLTLPLPPELLQSKSKNGVRMTARADRYPFENGTLAFPLFRVSLIPANNGSTPKWIARTQVQPAPGADRRSRFTLDMRETSVVQLPVYYYPFVMRVRVDGKNTTVENVGPYVAVTLAPGRHRVIAWYAGIGWANVISGVAWALVAVGLATAAFGVGRWRLNVSNLATRGEFSVPTALVAFAAVGVIVSAPTAWREIAKRLAGGVAVKATASHSTGEDHPPANAFDGDESTEWAAPGGEPEVVLTVVPQRPAALRKVSLESRQSGLFESWQAVRIDSFRGGTRVGFEAFSMPQAATQPIVELSLGQPIVADRVEFHFSSPVTVTRDGGTRVEPVSTSPGYREIRLTWDK